jgi:hypothetical protein
VPLEAISRVATWVLKSGGPGRKNIPWCLIASTEHLSAYLKETFGLSAKVSSEVAQRLLGLVIYPRFVRALFGMDELAETFDDDAIAADFDLKPIRKAIADLIGSLDRR